MGGTSSTQAPAQSIAAPVATPQSSQQQSEAGAPLVRKGFTLELPPQPTDNINTIKKVFLDDVRMIDSRHSQKMPPLIKSEVEKAVAKDAARICYETEKKMARCVQDKLYTAWKCQKERDEYYQCTWKYKNDPEIMNMMRWKYNLGTFHGEIFARRKLMQALWNEYFPDREIHHEWAQD